MNPFSKKQIRSLYEKGFSAPLLLQRSFPLPPWELYERLGSKYSRSFFLDRWGDPRSLRRFSYLGWNPYLSVTGTVLHDGDGSLRAQENRPRFCLEFEGEFQRTVKNPDLIRELRKLFSGIRVPPGFSSDCFTGGAVGYFGYELAEEFESIAFRAKPKVSYPSLGLLFFRDLVVFDCQREIYYLISWMIPNKGISFEKALARSGKNLAEMENFMGTRENPALPANGRFKFVRFRPEISRTRFERMVRKAKDYIRAGDIYQANLSQRFTFTFEGSPLKLYARLRETNPAPFAAALQWDDLFIASSSPELLVAKRGPDCVTCPIAGTRPRGNNSVERRRFLRELRTNEKERAEHLMLVDLERNDLGRVSGWRSVRVKELMRLEKYARVIHIVSEITSRLRPSQDAWDLLKAMFPGGTITGCPKIRSMEIIDELEPVERGIYTGSLGYVGFDGDLTLNIAIRTLVLQGNQGHLQVGAGIVADSDPGREYEETLAKGEALAEALIQASV